MVRNFKLTLCYDGTRYSGWQRQGNTGNTLQGKLQELLSRLLEADIEVQGSGRTDAGVHARRQVCSFKADTTESSEAMLASIRRYLPQDIGAIALEEVPLRFHARLNCREKTYCYRLWTADSPDIFERNYRYAFTHPLDDDKMKQAAFHLLGTHDFSAFTSDKRMKKSRVRTIRQIRFERGDNTLDIYFTGDGFLYNMVRILAGTLLEVGIGERDPASMTAILASLDRSRAGATAPPNGLFLWDVRYDEQALSNEA